jgi:opacity protein-like surface antigen
MMRNSVVAAAVAALAWAGMARAQAPQNDAPVRDGTGGSGVVSTQTYQSQQTSSVYGDPALNAPPAKTQEEVERELRGVSVVVGAGVEGYTGSLAPRVAVGPAWNLLIDFHPTSVLGLELAYVGALNSVKFDNFGLSTPRGADIIRNGGHAAVTFAFGPWMVQPFVLAGVGVDHYTVNQNARDVGFQSTTAGYLPFGGGIRGQIDHVVVDLRGTWSLPFSDNLFPGGTGQNTLGLNTGNYGRWNATLNIGGAF